MDNNITEVKKKRKPATAKFKVGQVWYVAMKGNPHECVDVTILEIISNNRVRVQYNTRKAPIYTYRAEELHKTPDKTMPGRKGKERALRQMEEKRMTKQKKGIKQSLQDKVKQLSYRGYAFKNEDGKFALKNVYGASINADTIEELEQYVDEKLIEFAEFKEKLLTKKYIYISDEWGTALYKIVNISNKKLQISCNWAREEVPADPSLVIDETDVPMYKIKKGNYGEHLRKNMEEQKKLA